jgi:hypothetical protein
MKKHTYNWTEHELLSTRQVAILLGYDPVSFADQEFEWMPEPEEGTNLYRPEDFGKLIKESTANEKASVRIQSDELLVIKQIAAMHSPPVAPNTFDFYFRLAKKRADKGLQSTNPAPQPDEYLAGRPVWHPAPVRDYLRNRPGPGNHITGTKRHAYRGGRVPYSKLASS